jgi:hypothetical protein
MNKRLSRRDFLKLAGVTSAGLALSACGVKAIELPTATLMPPTGTPLPTETLTPTVTSTPVLPLEQLPQTEQALTEFVQACKAVGVDISTDQLIQNGLEIRTITSNDKAQHEIALVHVDVNQGNTFEGDYPILIKTETEWKEIALKSGTDIPIGTTVSKGDSTALKFNEIVSPEFSICRLIESMQERWWNNGVTSKEFIEKAIAGGMSEVRMTNILFHQDIFDQKKWEISENGVKTFLKYRFGKALTLIKEYKGQIKFSLSIADEPFFLIDNIQGFNGVHYIGEFADKDISKWGAFDVFYHVFGKHWVVEATKSLWDVATEIQLIPGSDFSVIGMTEPGVEFSGLLQDEMIQQTLAMKKAVGDNSTVQIDLGFEYQVGDINKEQGRYASIPASKIDMDKIIQSAQKAAKLAGSRIHATDIDFYGLDEKELISAATVLINALRQSGVIDSITFFRGANPANSMNATDWASAALFNSNGEKTIYSYAILKGMIG